MAGQFFGLWNRCTITEKLGGVRMPSGCVEVRYAALIVAIGNASTLQILPNPQPRSESASLGPSHPEML